MKLGEVMVGLWKWLNGKPGDRPEELVDTGKRIDKWKEQHSGPIGGGVTREELDRTRGALRGGL